MKNEDTRTKYIEPKLLASYPPLVMTYGTKTIGFVLLDTAKCRDGAEIMEARAPCMRTQLPFSSPLLQMPT
jgi:hypothetical protein